MTSSFVPHRPARTWLRITLIVPAEMTDAAGVYLADLTGQGVEINALQSDSTTQTDRVIGYLLQEGEGEDIDEKVSELDNFLKSMTANFPDSPPPEKQIDTINEEDWGKNWKAYFKPLRITERLVIKPTWENYNVIGDEKVIEMDPGLAFGTGHHASTHLALTLIDDIFHTVAKPERVLDAGTGTGILAMGCGLLGARKVTAVDNDPDAVATAQGNVEANNLDTIIKVGIDEVASLDGQYDLIIANITHDVLQLLAPKLVRLLAPCGRLILAGILRDDQEQSIVRIYAGLGLVHNRTIYEDEWAGLLFTKDVH
jgi:ribosomal protein L11 methyltransferase